MQHFRFGGSNPLTTRRRAARFAAPRFDAFFDIVAHDSGLSELVFWRAGEAGWIREAPVEALGDAGKNRTTLGAGFVTDADDVGERFAGFEHVKDGFGGIARNIEADFTHRFDDKRIELARFETGAVGLEFLTA